MAGVIPNVEEGRILEDYVANIIDVRLFSNNVTPTEAFTLASFTEVAGGGYADIALDPGDWVVTLGDPSEIQHPTVDFQFTGATTAPSTVYGYYLVDTVTGLLKGAERFSGTIVPLTPITGSVISITPTVEAS